MHFEQFYLGCLAHASYMLGSEGEAVVVDPQRDIEIYLEAAQKQNLQIRHIFETHLHADFVSGHNELAARTGATIYIGKSSRSYVSSCGRNRRIRIARGQAAHPRARNTWPYARKHLPGRHGRREIAAAVGCPHRRHALHRGRRQARSVADAHPAATRRVDVRLAPRQAAEAAGRSSGLPSPRCRIVVRPQHARRALLDHRHGTAHELCASDQEPGRICAADDGQSARTP